MLNVSNSCIVLDCLPCYNWLLREDHYYMHQLLFRPSNNFMYFDNRSDTRIYNRLYNKYVCTVFDADACVFVSPCCNIYFTHYCVFNLITLKINIIIQISLKYNDWGKPEAIEERGRGQTNTRIASIYTLFIYS